MNNFKIWLAEFTGTFILVFVGAGAVIANVVTSGALDIVGVALAFGFAIMASIYIFGGISGSHINPAVTVAFLAAGKISARRAIGYVVSQLVGAVVAAYALLFVYDSLELVAVGTTALNTNVSFYRGIFIEFLLTFFLMTAVLAFVARDTARPIHGAIIVGLVVSMDILFGAILTGASMNPARTFGPALVSGVWSNHAVYWIGPAAGAIAAVFAHRVWSSKAS